MLSTPTVDKSRPPKHTPSIKGSVQLVVSSHSSYTYTNDSHIGVNTTQIPALPSFGHRPGPNPPQGICLRKSKYDICATKLTYRKSILALYQFCVHGCVVLTKMTAVCEYWEVIVGVNVENWSGRYLCGCGMLRCDRVCMNVVYWGRSVCVDVVCWEW